MKKNTEGTYIALCCQQVEAQLNWGSSAVWTNQDFENLSEQIREKTGVTLSSTTLKRIWGRVKYDSAPTVTTLNTLAQFLGYENWRRFRTEHDQDGSPGDTRSTPNATPRPDEAHTQPGAHSKGTSPIRPRKKTRPVWIAATAAILIAIAIFGFMRSKKTLNAAEYQFSSRKTVTEGVPNTVVFDDNAERAPEDSVFIQQNWDPTRRVKVSRQQHQATSVYYYPGHFQAKLVVSGQIVKEHDLQIRTRGWLPVIEQQPVPVYFKEEEARSGDMLGLSIAQIRSKNISLQPQTPWVRYSNIGNWEAVNTDRFIFEAELKNDFGEGSAICRHAQVLLVCEGGAIIIPLASKGCESELNLLIAGQFFSGKSNDLSGLGTDLASWVKLRCEARDGRIKILVNGRPAYETALTSEALKICGVTFRFQGTGSIRNVKLAAS